MSTGPRSAENSEAARAIIFERLFRLSADLT